jgi:Pvc16 N-terminal domain
MSNYLAIATVTAALQQILQTPVKDAVGGATVGFNRPDGTSSGKGNPLVNVYLYQVTPNSAYRNDDLPARRSDGTLVHKLQAALDLHYLFTFHGNDDQLEPQRMLGAVVSTLHAQPLLSTQNIQAAATQHGFLAGSGLDGQVERVKFTPTSLSLDEFTKLWSAFFQVEYSLSAAYQASLVLIESDDTPQESPPVAARNVYALPLRRPTITQVVSQAGTNLPILPTSTLVVKGGNLLAPLTLVRTGEVLTAPSTVTDKAIILPVPADLAAGVQGLQVIQQLQIGTPPAPHAGFESNVAPFVLHPVIVPQAATASQISVQVTPTVQTGQRAVLLLNEATTPPPPAPTAYTFSLPPLASDASALTFDITNVKGGGTTYFIRVSVDGAESPLDLDPSSPTFGPWVTIT